MNKLIFLCPMLIPHRSINFIYLTLFVLLNLPINFLLKMHPWEAIITHLLISLTLNFIYMSKSKVLNTIDNLSFSLRLLILSSRIPVFISILIKFIPFLIKRYRIMRPGFKRT